MPKKNKIQEPVTPQELSKFNDKTTQNPTVRKYHVNADAKNITGLKKRRLWLRIALGVAIVILLILFLVSLLVSKWGDLVIEIDKPLINKGFYLSEDPDFGDGNRHVSLSAKQAVDVTNITYSWLPTDLDTSKNGEHNGRNYLAYTFYLQNSGEEEITYNYTLDVTGVAKSADEACRVMVYKNGDPTIYAKGKFKNREQAEPVDNKEASGMTTKFVADNVVMNGKTDKFKPGDKDKYTIVIWIEGYDDECVDEIRDGWIRMRMLFSLDDEDATKSPFGDYYDGKVEDDTYDYAG